MARRALLIFLLAVAPAIAGCRVQQRIRPVVVGPIPGAPSIATFQRLLATSRAAGYDPSAIDARVGVFRVRSQSTTRTGEHGFLVQCYADGYVQITPFGATVTASGDEAILPATLRNELVLLAQVLSAAGRVE